MIVAGPATTMAMSPVTLAVTIAGNDSTAAVHQTVKSIVSCSPVGPLHLVLAHDGISQERGPHAWPAPADAMTDLEAIAARHANDLASVGVLRMETPLGRQALAARAAGAGLERAEFTVVIAAGLVLAADALRWFAFARDEIIASGAAQAATAVASGFPGVAGFDGPDVAERARALMDHHGLVNQYLIGPELPVTCFGVDRTTWAGLAGLPPDQFADRFGLVGLTCAAPVVPRTTVAPAGLLPGDVKEQVRLVTADDSVLAVRWWECFDGDPALLNLIDDPQRIASPPEQPRNFRRQTTPVRGEGDAMLPSPAGQPSSPPRAGQSQQGYLDQLGRLYQACSPRLALHIGLADAAALRLAQGRVIGVDPDPPPAAQALADAGRIQIVRDDSLAFLRRYTRTSRPAAGIEFAYIDGAR
jgi:hypothetical protein